MGTWVDGDVLHQDMKSSTLFTAQKYIILLWNVFILLITYGLYILRNICKDKISLFLLQNLRTVTEEVSWTSGMDQDVKKNSGPEVAYRFKRCKGIAFIYILFTEV